MTKLSDAIAALESERDALLVQCEKQEERIAKQAGAIMENRARIAAQDKIISRLTTLVANYQSFLRHLGHSHDDLKKQEANATELMGSGLGNRAGVDGQLNVPSESGGNRPGLPNPSLVKRLEEAQSRDLKSMNGSGVH